MWWQVTYVWFSTIFCSLGRLFVLLRFRLLCARLAIRSPYYYLSFVVSTTANKHNLWLCPLRITVGITSIWRFYSLTLIFSRLKIKNARLPNIFFRLHRFLEKGQSSIDAVTWHQWVQSFYINLMFLSSSLWKRIFSTTWEQRFADWILTLHRHKLPS